MTRLPTFERPPLAEVFLATQHTPLPRLRTAHLGEFLLRTESGSWEMLQEGPALGQTHEPVGEEAEWLSPGVLEVGLDAGARLRARNGAKDRMLQVENGWLALNWMLAGGRPYPRYESLRSEFEGHWARWEHFLADSQLGAPAPNLWEIGYVNVFPRGELWTRPADWVDLFPSLVAGGPPIPERLQTLSGRWAFRIGPGLGRLQVFVEHALRNTPGPTECVLLRLVARGPVDEDRLDLWTGFDRGHEAIVRAFAAVLSPRARKELGYVE